MAGIRIPKFKSKADAKKHGIIQYGKGNFQVKHVEGGWKAYFKRWWKE